MRLRLTRRAVRDLNDIAARLESENPRARVQVDEAIQNAFRLIVEHPWAGRVQRQGVRRLVLPRYRYLIFYRLDRSTDTVEVVTVRHGARAPARWSN